MAEASLGTAQYTDDIQYVENEGIQERLYFERVRDVCVGDGGEQKVHGKFWEIHAAVTKCTFPRVIAVSCMLYLPANGGMF